jgi:hypothetical protein
VFGSEMKVRGKEIARNNVKGKKVDGKLVESEIIFRLFGLSESVKKVRGKKDVYIYGLFGLRETRRKERGRRES